MVRICIPHLHTWQASGRHNADSEGSLPASRHLDCRSGWRNKGVCHNLGLQRDEDNHDTLFTSLEARICNSLSTTNACISTKLYACVDEHVYLHTPSFSCSNARLFRPALVHKHTETSILEWTNKMVPLLDLKSEFSNSRCSCFAV